MGCNTRASRESEFYCDSGSGTVGAVNPSNVLVEDLSPCDGQTHAEEECALGLYQPEVRHLFKRGFACLVNLSNRLFVDTVLFCNIKHGFNIFRFCIVQRGGGGHNKTSSLSNDIN